MHITNNYWAKIQRFFLAGLLCVGLSFVDGFAMTAAGSNAAETAKVTTGAQPAGQQRLKMVRDKSLEREEKRQEKNAGIDARSLQEIEDQTTADQYTQTEGYFQLPALSQKVTEWYTGDFQVVRYMDVVSRIMVKEAQFRNSHWAFYHGHTSDWMVPQDLYTMLYNHFNPSAKRSNEDFVFLRWGEWKNPETKEFLKTALTTYGLVDDNGEYAGALLSTNLSPFGNTGWAGECTWLNFMRAVDHAAPERKFYEQILNEWNLPHTYIDELMALAPLVSTKQEAVTQIFIPKDIVDDIGYLAWSTGIPFQKEAIDWVKTNIKNKRYRTTKAKDGSITPATLNALAGLKEKFKKEQGKNPIFREMLADVEKGDYSVNSFLKIYCNKPWKIPYLNNAQARFIFSNDVLLKPESGIKMFRHTTVEDYKMRAYRTKFEEIVNKILAEKRTA